MPPLQGSGSFRKKHRTALPRAKGVALGWYVLPLRGTTETRNIKTRERGVPGGVRRSHRRRPSLARRVSVMRIAHVDLSRSLMGTAVRFGCRARSSCPGLQVARRGTLEDSLCTGRPRCLTDDRAVRVKMYASRCSGISRWRPEAHS